jgi:hypothetical protein
VNKYLFIDAQKAKYETLRLCRIFGVPESSYFDWNHHGREIAEQRTRDEAELVTRIEAVHEDSDATYGSPRVHDALKEQGALFRCGGLLKRCVRPEFGAFRVVSIRRVQRVVIVWQPRFLTW